MIIAKIVFSYVFCNSNSESKIYSLNNSNIETIENKKFTSFDYDFILKFIEFCFKLSDNDEKMIEILIDDFFDLMKYLNNFKYFFFIIN